MKNEINLWTQEGSGEFEGNVSTIFHVASTQETDDSITPETTSALSLLAILDGGASSESYNGVQYFNPNEVPGDFIDNDSNGYIDDYSGIDLQMNGISGTHSGPESNNWSPAEQPHGSEMTRAAAAEINKVSHEVEAYTGDAKIMHVDITETRSAGYEIQKEGIMASLISGAKVISLSFGVGESGVLANLEPLVDGTDTVLVLPNTAGNNHAYGDNIVISDGLSFHTAQLAGQITAILAVYPEMNTSELHAFLIEHSYNNHNYRLNMDKVLATINSDLSGDDPVPVDPVDDENDSFLDSGGDDNWAGGLGNDDFHGGLGRDQIDGGEGIDNAYYARIYEDYVITQTNSGIEISANSGDEGNDVLTNVERVHFSDTSIAFDIDGNAGQAYRLYKAAFNREPDSIGLGFWINALDKGASLLDVAKGFTKSAEFSTLYSADSRNDDFISALYNNILDRDGDANGHDYWVGLLDNSLALREDVLIEFSESNENQDNALTIIGETGIDFIPLIA